jgi:hypothetical protein
MYTNQMKSAPGIKRVSEHDKLMSFFVEGKEDPD